MNQTIRDLDTLTPMAADNQAVRRQIFIRAIWSCLLAVGISILKGGGASTVDC